MTSPVRELSADIVKLKNRAIARRGRELGFDLGSAIKVTFGSPTIFYSRGRVTACRVHLLVILNLFAVKELEGIGFAIRNPIDKFDAVVGRNIAFRRAMSDALNHITRKDFYYNA